MAVTTKPVIKPVSTEEALKFATGGDKTQEQDITPARKRTPKKRDLAGAWPTAEGPSSKKRKLRGGKSGLVPEGYTRLTANIPTELHIKLKVKAASEGRSVVDILEEVFSKCL